ncbi:Replication stress response regulator SDE2 [Aphelenchoides bicaudatus]|nr:Replication stress response regulator SDE2 [Aphelenchoides bicaudatus]
MEVFNQRSLFSGYETGVIDSIRDLPLESYYLISSGKFVNVDDIQPADVFQINFRLLGGKGGFGSILRSFRISKSSNQLMCRDLNGRRIGDVKESERLKKWNSKKADREKEKERKKKEKYEKLKQGGPKHQFANVDYLRQRDLVLDQTEDAIEAGLEAAMNSVQTDRAIDDALDAAMEAGPSGLSSTSKKESSAKAEESKEDESSDDSDLEMGFISVARKKRKLNVAAKK